MKASIDAAAAKDAEILQLRADLHEARRREEYLQGEVRHKEENVAHCLRYWGEDCRKMRAVEDDNVVLRQRLSHVKGREKETLKKLDDLKQCLRNLGGGA